MEALLSDLRLSVRGLARRPAFTAVALLSLALGIGANTAIFTAVKAVFLQPFPVREPERLVAVFTSLEGLPALLPVSYPNFVDLRERSRTFSALITATPVSLSLSGGRGEPERIDGEMVSGNYFDVLGVRAARGRTFLAEEDSTPGGHPVVMLSYGLWQRRFGSDPGVLGRSLSLNGHPFTVIGVAAREFRGTNGLSASDFWVPLAMHEQALRRRVRPFFEQRRATLLGVIGRLAPGTPFAKAREDLRRVGRELAREYPEANEGRALAAVPILQAMVDPNQRESYVKAGFLLAAMVGVVLLVACANVANMLLARAAGRRREIAIRLAIGARRRQLVRQLMLESLVLALAAGALGLLIASWSRGLVAGLQTPYLPATMTFALDARVLLFTLGLSVFTALLFGLVPALQASRPEVVTALKGGEMAAGAGGRRFTLRGLLVVAQVALSLVSLIGAALFLLSLRNAQRIDPGFDSAHLLTASFDLDSSGYDEVRGQQLLDRMVERVRALPGVRSAAVAENLVLAGQTTLRRTIAVEGREPRPDETLIVQPNAVGLGYLDTMGIPVLRGRDFTPEDRAGGRRVVIVNRTMADRLWPGTDPIGRRFTMKPTDDTFAVVGVAQDVKYNSLGEEPQLAIYLPIAQAYASSATLHVRATGDPARLAGPVRRTLRELEPSLPLLSVRTLSQVLGALLWAPRAGAVLLALFGALAMVLAIIGIYGVMSYSVTQRHREIGIRLALGARRSNVVLLFLGEGLRMIVAGLVLGLLVAFLSSRLIASLLYGVDARNAFAFVGTALLLAGVAILATYVPARRATAVHPMIVMRQD
jgi:putative ABC transport system permease protein